MLERRYSDIVKRISRVRNNSFVGKQKDHQETLAALACLDRHVTFGETKSVEIERCLPNEKRLIWYSMKEFQSSYNFEVSENWRRHAEKHSKDEEDDDSWTWRGMEHVVSGTSKTDRVRHVVTEILKFQREQRSSKKGWKKNSRDAAMEEELRQYCRTITKHDRIAAEKLGGADARAVGKNSKTNFMIQGTMSIVHAIQRSTTIHKTATHSSSHQQHSDNKAHDSRELRSKEIQYDGDETEHPKSSLRIWSSPREMEKFFLRKIRRTVRKDDLNTAN